MGDDRDALDLLTLTTRIVVAYVSHNAIPPGDLARVSSEVHAALLGLGLANGANDAARRRPAVTVRRSVRPDAIFCLEDGLRFKSLKRHLMTSHGLTPEQYRERWGLHRDYPMVSAGYSEIRSGLAKAAGLGRNRRP